MTINNIKQQILEHLEVLPGEQVKSLLKTWLSVTDGDLEDFEQLLSHESTQSIEEIDDYGEIDTTLNFQPLTQAQMVEKSRQALEAYGRTGAGLAHERVREWADFLGTDKERPCPR
ncbi:hypothetical protein ACN23B_27880 (plasmid) [Anabaena sp. FACHB-709]|uniref:Uncharacterized protein n=2 Tax=Nostocaceae TaxID=1162 RepID=A0A1Z4KUC7_ANAVA|nr:MULTISPECIES: hypothetical protein [Nostocaceae]BAY72645.1 hypothetical protein NIES23_54730 [Trichormus variabilis NIES-23]MBD2174225.1 hypothetical protein [Anabaena cylindrica FACHB-318]MBD2266013.1 hypothetical protein [Anabaena sp. FACHB-709]MBD2275454.1 hypothetical protein [Nostoc sp. PCC 7120 = FACHB-418]MBD2287335.1 hypothetical protein [Anabaena cylindrica FACHB-170]